MCVSTGNYKCCCGCMSLTAATITLGALYLLGGIWNAIIGNWLGFAFDVAIAGVFSLVIFKPNSICIRQLIFFGMAILQGLGALGFVALVIFGIVADWEEQVCSNYWDDLYQYYNSEIDCEEGLRQIFIIVIVVSIFIGLPLIFCTLQILYYGWKEQENIRRERMLETAANLPANTALYQPVAVQPQAPNANYYNANTVA